MPIQTPWDLRLEVDGTSFANRAQENDEALGLAIPSRAGVVTTLPTSPTDGMEIYYVADATNGIVWSFRYRAASAAASKWEFVGGSPLFDIQTGATTRAVAAYGDLAAGAAPTFTLALPGDYFIEVGANMAPGSAGNGMFMSFSVNGAAALDTDAVLAYYGAGTAPGQSGNVNAAIKLSLAAGTTIQAKFKMQGAVAGNIDKRWIKIVPYRVGP